MLTRKRFINVAEDQLKSDHNFDLGGLDTFNPDEDMKANKSPYLKNVRKYARNSDTNSGRSTISTRMGPGYYATTPNEAAMTVQNSLTGASTFAVTPTIRLTDKFIATNSNRLDRVDIKISATVAAGPLLVDVYSDNAGVPGILLATSSISRSSVTSTPASVACRFIEAPQLANGSTYWIVVYQQDEGTGSYLIATTTAATTAKTSINSGVTFSASAFAMNINTYTSATGAYIGLDRYYPSTGTNKTLAVRPGFLEVINDITGVTSTLLSSLSTIATKAYFDFASDNAYMVNGVDSPVVYNGTTASTLAGSPPVSSYIRLHKNRLFFVSASDPTRLVFSEAADFTNFPAVNFIYIPTPKTSDVITGLVVQNDNLVIFTKKTKYVLYGSDLSSFTLRRSTGLQGCVAPDSIQFQDNFAYFLSDSGIYRFNGATDELISVPVTNILDTITDKSKATSSLFDNKYTLYYPANGSGVNNESLVFDMFWQEWFRDTNTYIGKCLTWRGSGDTTKLIQCNALIPSIYYGNVAYSDLGKPLEFEYRTKYFSYGVPAAKKQVKRWYPQLRGQTGAYNVSLQYDKDMANNPTSVPVPVQSAGNIWGSGILWGSGLLWGSRPLIKPRITCSGRANYFQFRYLRTGADNPVEILGQQTFFHIEDAR